VAEKNENKVSFKIDGRSYEGVKGESLLAAIRRYGYEVPSLCYHEAVSSYGACRLCLVEVQEGRRRKLTTSCNYPLQDGIEVFLDTEKVVHNRKMVFKLLLAMAPEAQSVRELAADHGVIDTPFEINKGNKCIDCGLCARVCKEIVEADAIGFSGRGLSKQMVSPYDEANEACIGLRGGLPDRLHRHEGRKWYSLDSSLAPRPADEEVQGLRPSLCSYLSAQSLRRSDQDRTFIFR